MSNIRRNLKKQIILLLVFLMIITISGCSSNTTANSNSQDSNSEVSSSTHSTDDKSSQTASIDETNEQYIYLKDNNYPTEIHLDRDYDWYIDQGTTGQYRNNNCGPSCGAMAAKWYKESFEGTAEEARNLYPRDGEWWNAVTVKGYLKAMDIPVEVVGYTDYKDIINVLNTNKIVIACLDTTYITRNTNTDENTGRFYDYEGGHFVIIKGYKFINNELYFESYDPNNWNAKYANGEEMGIDRYFDYKEIDTAIQKHWAHLLTIGD